MNQDFAKAAEQVTAFQKMWMESIMQLTQTVFNNAPDSASPDMLRQMRSGIFQSMARSWDEFLRSPQFLEGMRQWMDGTTGLRKMRNEWMGRVRNELQAPSRDDIDTIMLSVRHMEQRLLARVEELSQRIDSLNGSRVQTTNKRAANRSRASQTRKNSRRSTPEKGKVNAP